jgi:hypothetical protein
MKIGTALSGVASAAFMLVLAAVQAKPVTLACGPAQDNRAGLGFYHFDESEGTAGTGSADKPDAYGGTNPATFSSTEISWEYMFVDPAGANRIHRWYVLSRLTGGLNVWEHIKLDPPGPPNRVIYCSVVQATL